MKNLLNILLCSLILLSFYGCDPVEPTPKNASIPKIAFDVIYASMDDATEIMKKYGYTNRVIRYLDGTQCCEFSNNDKRIIQCQLSNKGYVETVITAGDPYWTCVDFNSALGYFIEWEEATAKNFNCFDRESEIYDQERGKTIGEYGDSEQDRISFLNYLKNTKNQRISAYEEGYTYSGLAYYIAFGQLENGRYYVMYQLTPDY